MEAPPSACGTPSPIRRSSEQCSYYKSTFMLAVTSLTMSSATALLPQQQQQQQPNNASLSASMSNSTAASSPDPPPLTTRVVSFLIKHHLPLGIVVGVVLGALYPPPGRWLSALPTTTIAICFIFCVQGLRLDTEEAKDALRSYRASLYGFITILFLSPFLSFPLQWMPLDPPELTYGLCLFLCMPTTISTGVIFTRESHGNASLALLLCIGTTLLSIPLMPFTIPFFALRSVNDVSFDTGKFLLNLCLTILLPLVIGKGVRQFVPHAPAYIQRAEPVLKYGSSIALLALPFMQISNSAELITQLSVVVLLMTVEFSIVLHGVMLLCNWLVCHYGRSPLLLDDGKVKAIVFCCSEKTLAIAVAVLPLLPWDEQRKGAMSVAIIIVHLVQTTVDGVLASLWGARYLTQEAERTKREAVVDGTVGGVTELAQNVYVKMVEEEKEERKEDTRATDSFIVHIVRNAAA